VAQVDSSKQLPAIIITATRTKTSITKTPFSVSVLDSSKLKQSLLRTVPESLIGLSCVFVQKTNHGGGSPIVRGLTGNQNLLLIDGFRLNNAIFRYGPNQYLTLVDPFLVERIEVVKGTGSVQFGSDAMGGVINVITRQPRLSVKPVFSSTLLLRGTSQGMERTLRPEIQFSNKKIATLVSGVFSDFGDLKGGDTSGFQRPSGYRQQSLDVRTTIGPGKNWRVQMGMSIVNQNDVPLYHKYQLEKVALSKSELLQRKMVFLKTQKSYANGVIRSITLDISQQQLIDHRLSKSLSSSPLVKEFDTVNSSSITTDIATVFTTFWSANTGVELNLDYVKSTRFQYNTPTDIVSRRGLYPNGARYHSFAAYNLHHFTLKQLQIETGVRFHQNKITIQDASIGAILIKPSAWVYMLGTSYAISEQLTLFGNINSAFRAPNIDDMGTLGIIDFRYEQPAYDLKPERSINKEMGVRWKQRNFQVSVAAFHVTLKDLIGRIKTSAIINNYPVYIKKNIEEAFIRGAEFEITSSPFPLLLVQANLSYLFGHNLTRNEPLRRIPPINGQLSITYSRRKWQAGIINDYATSQQRLAQGDKDDNRIPLGGTPGYTIYHLFVAKEIGKLQYRFRLNNLINTDYRTHGSGINSMGRSLSISLFYTLKN
jgi:outer membrane receptor protein involved in Fe transport